MAELLRKYIKVLLFLSSYTFLFLILAVKNWGNWNLVALMAGIIVISNGVLAVTLKVCSGIRDQTLRISKVRNSNSANLAYIVTYIVPFMATDCSRVEDVIALFILFLVIGFLYIKSDMVAINPMLNMLGYNVLSVETEDGGELTLVVKNNSFKELKSKKFVGVTEDVYLG